MISGLPILLAHPRLLRRYEQIFLLSHMRANTSLFGHILGANPEIEGYYEMHIGYFSWRSRWRQKLLYFAGHSPKPDGRYLFDKILHNDHPIAPAFLRNSKIIFSLRPPEMTIPSIVSLYRKIDPDHEHAQPDRAAEYYCGRLRELARLVDRTPEYCYVDAQALRTNSDEVLAGLSGWLGLKIPLSTDYEVKPLTGEGRAGDSSENIRQGTIIQSQADYSSIALDPLMLREATELFTTTREKMIAASDISLI